MIIDNFLLKKLISKEVEVIDILNKIYIGTLIDFDDSEIQIQKEITSDPIHFQIYSIDKKEIKSLKKHEFKPKETLLEE
jgi:small nuclear ribonucleoprotein (snRNP)-like protein